MPEIHTVENIPSLPPDLPATDSQSPKVALTQNQIDAIQGAAGDLMPTLKKWWAIFVMVAGIAYGISRMDPASLLPPAQTTKTTPADDSKKLDELKQVIDQQKKLIDSLNTKKGP